MSMKNILIVWGGWEGHQPRQCVACFEPFLADQGFNVVLSNSLSIFADTQQMKYFDLIVPC